MNINITIIMFTTKAQRRHTDESASQKRLTAKLRHKKATQACANGERARAGGACSWRSCRRSWCRAGGRNQRVGGWARMIRERRIAANIINSTTEAQSTQRTHIGRRNGMGFGEQNPNPTIQDREEAKNTRLLMSGAEGLPGKCPAILTNTVKYYYCMRLAASFAGVAKPGQRRWIQGPVTKVFMGSNPIPRT